MDARRRWSSAYPSRAWRIGLVAGVLGLTGALAGAILGLFLGWFLLTSVMGGFLGCVVGAVMEFTDGGIEARAQAQLSKPVPLDGMNGDLLPGWHPLATPISWPTFPAADQVRPEQWQL